MANNTALTVDLAGLRLLVERRGKSFALLELVQNAWDEEGVTNVDVTMRHEGRNRVAISVTDDSPDGFKDLTHAYTLFAPSKKKGNAEQRGRFNLGEKLVIALADHFTVETTTGGVHIDVTKNTRSMRRVKRERGSMITALLRMTQWEMEDAEKAFWTLIPPAHITTTINGERLVRRNALSRFVATLQTEIADDDGFLRPTRRSTVIEVYEPLGIEVPTLYEMGIPVVATDDAYHVNVLQKVPLNTDRDNVTPAFLRDVRTLVLNEMVSELTPEQATTTWVNEALEDELVTSETVASIITARFGEKRVVYDPSDAEANRIAVSKGYTLIPANAFSKAGWNAVRGSGAALPAGRVTPSPKPFSPDGTPLELIPEDEYSPQQWHFVNAVRRLHADLIGTRIHVSLTKDRAWKFAAAYGEGRVTFNIARLTADINNERMLGTVLHEFAHHYGDHLTHAFDDGIALISARLIRRIVADPNYLTSTVIQHG